MPSSYTLRDIESLLGLSPGVVRGLIAAGFVAPQRGPHNRYLFGFQDVVLLRTARALQAQRVAPRKILRSLRRLRASLPAELPLSGLRITAVGSEVVVSEGTTRRHVDSGQLLLDFELREAPTGEVRLIAPAPDPAAPDAAAWFERGASAESSDRRAAEAAYREVVRLAPGHVDASLNLGCLLCESGRCEEAAALYRAALGHRPDAALLHYNLGIALEDLQRPDEALASYEASLRLDPSFADAHFNAARLHEQAGRQRQAIRHYGEYRRLQR